MFHTNEFSNNIKSHNEKYQAYSKPCSYHGNLSFHKIVLFQMYSVTYLTPKMFFGGEFEISSSRNWDIMFPGFSFYKYKVLCYQNVWHFQYAITLTLSCVKKCKNIYN